MIRVLVVDDHVLFRKGVIAVINTQPGMKVVAEAANGIEAIKAAGEFHPDITIMDLNMPEMGGAEATSCLLKKRPETNVLILTVSDRDEDLFNALKAGAKGYLLKGTDSEQFVGAIAHVARGGVIISPYMAPKLLSEMGTYAKIPQPEKSVLSPREMEVLEIVGDGLSDKEIADKLLISLNTVKTHMKNILSKLHAKGRMEAIRFASNNPQGIDPQVKP